jgi:hypothetical protein
LFRTRLTSSTNFRDIISGPRSVAINEDPEPTLRDLGKFKGLGSRIFLCLDVIQFQAVDMTRSLFALKHLSHSKHVIGGLEIVIPSSNIETVPDHLLLVATVPFQVVDFLNVRPSCCFNSAFLSNACFLASLLSSASTASGELTLRYTQGAGTTLDEMDLHISSSLWKTCLDEALLIS